MNNDPNSDCKQCTESKLGWVHSAHTQNPSRAHTAWAVPRSWALLRARQAGRARMRAWSRAQLRLLRLPLSRPKAQVMTPNFNRPGRDLKSMSRLASALPTETPLSGPKPWSRHQTTTRQPESCRDIKSVSRHHSGHSRSRPQNGVTTPFLLPSPKPGRNTKTRPRPSWKLTYVATSISCRNIVSAHSGISRSRRQNPGRDLPHCYPCRDLKNDVATSNPTG